MIVCPVCLHQNDDFAITCASCSSYIQDRVPTLDFFAMLWLIVESPKQAFKKIILAEHKNYVLFLGMFLGIATIFAFMWGKKSGENYDNLFPALLMGTALGVVVCIPFFYALTAAIHAAMKLIGGKGKFKETYAVTGWSLVPIMFSVVFVLPLELATLGLFMFTANPSAFEVKPVVTSVLIGLDGLFLLWSFVLAGIGFSMLHRIKFIIGFCVILIVASAVTYLSFLVYSSFNI